ncbi:M23 family metallopeptidase [Microbacterium betulae]|uniref:M23 family metallopeptidase n=1 Tax=Microbacterium betulae TaxID=2981139 RepID=A0AA97FJG5_9MICO|nr:M23 family metallopeptidase [Microbacterium sp. AB]WOF23854.1 M23 family metallopeptidase [Microbacterium sp. AB]
MAAVIWPNGSATRPTVTSLYGNRTHPVSGVPLSFHHGIDLVGWSTVVAPCDGVVTLARYNGGAGNEVRIRRPNGDSVRLMHHASFLTREGATIRQGDPVGIMGTTGNSTGVHSHYEFRDAAWNSLEPNAYIAAANAGQGASVPDSNDTTPGGIAALIEGDPVLTFFRYNSLIFVIVGSQSIDLKKEADAKKLIDIARILHERDPQVYPKPPVYSKPESFFNLDTAGFHLLRAVYPPRG